MRKELLVLKCKMAALILLEAIIIMVGAIICFMPLMVALVSNEFLIAVVAAIGCTICVLAGKQVWTMIDDVTISCHELEMEES